MCKMTMKIRHVDTHRVSKEFRWTASSQNDGDKKQIYTSPKKPPPKQLLSIWSHTITFVSPSLLALPPCLILFTNNQN